MINAAGVWTDELQEFVGGRGKFRVRASKGIHLIVPRDRLHADTGIILRTEKSVLFIIPWGRHWIIGTTDTDWNLDLAHPGRRFVALIIDGFIIGLPFGVLMIVLMVGAFSTNRMTPETMLWIQPLSWLSIVATGPVVS